jgi:glycosyltransferase involved in cell wall biosynthesis
MRVLHLGRFYNANFGGLERHVALLIESLRGQVDCDNLVANDSFRGEVLDMAYYHVYKAPSAGVVAGVALAPTMPLWARRLHRDHAYDIVHLHFPDPLAQLVWCCMPPGPRLVITWHSDIVRQERLLKLYSPFLDNIVSRADGIIAATPAHFSSSTQMAACRDESRKHVVPYGINEAPYQFSDALARRAEEIRGRYPGKRLVFGVGRHVYYKGFEYLIRAIGETQDTVAVIGGNGPLTDKYARLIAELGYQSRVDLVGRIDDADLPAYYHAADLFCMPSVEKSEAFGIVQLEAMASGRPVICCQLANGVNYVNLDEVTGLAVPPRDPKALAQAINRLLDDEMLRKRMGQAARQRVHAEFSMQSMARGTLGVYRSVLGKQRT